MPISINGLGNGSRYFTSATHQLAGSAPLAMAESFVRSPTAPVGSWPSASKWRKDVDMVADAESLGTGVLAVTKLWTKTTSAQQKQWYGYATGTFLLGAQDASRMFFLKDGCAPPCSNTASPLSQQWSADMPLGAPTGPYRGAGGAFVRDFANGFVAVNPTTASTAVTVPAGSYLDQDGKSVSGTLTLGAHRGAILTPAPAADAKLCDGLVATIVGTTGNDVLIGTSGPDVIRALDGNDLIDGGGGDDVICGDDGGDTIHGGDGNDRLLGGRGDDFLDGGDGNDFLSAGNGADQLLGGNGADELRGSVGADILLGGSGNDLLKGEADDDTLRGDGGTDVCNGGTGTDSAVTCETLVDIET